MTTSYNDSDIDVENTSTSNGNESDSSFITATSTAHPVMEGWSDGEERPALASVGHMRGERRRELARVVSRTDLFEGEPTKKRPKRDTEPGEEDAEPDTFGGYGEVVAEVERVMSQVNNAKVYSSIGISPAKGFLIHGPHGCGKSLLASYVAAKLGLPLQTVSPFDLMSYTAATSIRSAFDMATFSHPSVVLIDGLEALSDRNDVQKFIATLMDRLIPGVVVVGTTDSLDCVTPFLRIPGRFYRDFKIEVPGLADRRAILEVLTKNIKLDDGLSLEELAELTPGYVGGDLKALISEAGIVAVDEALGAAGDGRESNANRQLNDDCLKNLRVKKKDFEIALKRVTPSAKKEGFATVPEVTWEDVGSSDSIRKHLETSIILPVTHPEEFAAMGIERPSGILLCGPPGCGKTLLAKALANELRVNFLSVKGPELLSMYVGESERGVRQCFQRAKSCRPCIVFLDEVDSLCPRRYGESSNMTARVVNQLLTELDGVGERRGVYLLAATNRPDVLDPALLRPGRLDKVVWVDLPSAAGRADILRALTRRVPLQDVDLTALAAKLTGFSGADLSAVVKEASVLALTRHLQHKTCLHLTMDLLLQAASKLRPSITPKELAFYKNLKSSSDF